jgi:hypothetical protein
VLFFHDQAIARTTAAQRGKAHLHSLLMSGG